MGYMNVSIDTLALDVATDINALDTRVTATEATNTTQTTDIAALNTRVTETETINTTQTTDIAALDTRVTSTESVNTTQTTDIATNASNLTNFQANLANATTGGTLVGYTPPSTGLASTIRAFLDSLWDSAGATLLRWTSGAIGAVTRTVASKLADYVDVTDFGAVGDGVTDCSPAVRLAYDHAVLKGMGIRYPPGNFNHLSAVVMAAGVPVVGAGEGQTTLTAAFNGPLFQFNNAAKFNYKTFGGFRYVGPASAETNTDSCCFDFTSASVGMAFCTFENITVNSTHAFMRSNALAYDSGVTGANKWAGQINWCSFDNINLRSGVKYGFLWNQGSGTGNSWNGGKPAIAITGGAYVEINGAPAAANENLGVVVGDLIFNDIHTLTESGVSATAAFFRGGPSTPYRSRILFNGCQFDAKMDYPLDLSATGTEWSNVVFNGNAIGGAVDLYSKIPTIRRSIVVDQGVSRWDSQYNGSISNGSGVLQSDVAFEVKVDPALCGGTTLEIFVEAIVAGVGPSCGLYKYLVRPGAVGANATTTEIAANTSGVAPPTGVHITVTPVVEGARFNIQFTPSNNNASTYEAQLLDRGGKVKVQNGRYL